VRSADAADLSGDALGERLGAREKWVVTGFELNEPNALFDALTLHLSGRGEILSAHEVRGRLPLPGDLAGRLREGRE
jgi:hypothetical protein